jgi:hypothetical protein
MTLQDKALMVIDRLTSDDFIQTMMYNLGMDRPIELTHEEILSICEKIREIYTVSHSACKSHSCYSVHKDWREETERLYKEIGK